MRPFEEHLARAQYEHGSRDGARLKAKTDRHLQRMAREERRRRSRMTLCYLTALCFGLLAALTLCAACQTQADPPPESHVMQAEDITAVTSFEPLAEDLATETDENALIEAALLAKAHRIDDCTVTHYCTCAKCCGKSDGITASGLQATPGVTVAVDPSVIPLGSDVLVDYGDGEIHYYRADDVGGAIKGAHIELCCKSHAEALELGVRTATVYWVEQEGQ